MNVLKLTTTYTKQVNVFDTYWMTGLVQKGRVRVTVPNAYNNIVAAELAAAQYLLTAKNVCGHNKAGAGLKLVVSNQEIPDLYEGRSSSAHLARYANFLRTRFLGTEIVFDESTYDWADEGCNRQVDAITVEHPPVTTLEVNGIGKVELTAHAVSRYVHRFDRKQCKAWRELSVIAKEVQPVVLLGRKAIHDIKHRRQGHYALDAKRNLLFVVTEASHAGALPRLVTVTRPEKIPLAAKTDSHALVCS